VGCAVGSLAQSLNAYKKFERLVSQKMWTRVGQYAPLELFCLWTKVHPFFRPTWKGLWLIEFFPDSTCRSVLQVFAIKVVVRNRFEIWTFFGTPKFYGAGLPKIITSASRHVWKGLIKILPVARRYRGAHGEFYAKF